MFTQFPNPLPRAARRASLPAIALGCALVATVACSAGQGGAEATGTLSSADSCPAGSLLQGVDTSSVQGTVDWTEARDAGVDWVIMKATQGDYDHDSAFPKSWPGAKVAGVVRGAYHFFDPTLDGVAQANYFLAAMGPLDAEDLAPVLDVECPTSPTANCLGGSGGSGAVPAADFRTRMLDWLTTVEAATGRKPIIYTYLDFFAETGAAGTGTNVDTTGLDAYPLWIAQYTGTSCFSVPAPWTEAALWQYDDTGSFAGISAAVDVDRAVGSIDELLGWPGPKRSSRADVNGDGLADACGRSSTGVTCALAQSGGSFGAPFAGPAWSDASGWFPAAYASTVQFADVNGDGKSDVCGRSAAGITCALSSGNAFGNPFPGPAWSDAEGWSVPAYYATVQFADVDGDGKADVCGRGVAGIYCAPSTGAGFGATFTGPAWSDAVGWSAPSWYRTIRFPDLDGDGRADVCGRSADGVQCALSNGSNFGPSIAGPAWSDAAGWGLAAYASTIQFPDLNGDGAADICGRSPDGLVCALSTGMGFGAAFTGPAWSDAAGWSAPAKYATIVFLDLNGDARADVCARDVSGMVCALSTGAGFGASFAGPAWSDADGWNQPHYYGTIAGGDVTGDGRDDLCARGSSGVVCAPSTGNGFGNEITGPAWSDAAWGLAPYWATTSIVGRAHAAESGGADGGAEGGGVEGGSSADAGAAKPAGSEDAGGTAISVSLNASASGAAGCNCRETRSRGADGQSGATVTFFGLALALACRRRRRLLSCAETAPASPPLGSTRPRRWRTRSRRSSR